MNYEHHRTIQDKMKARKERIQTLEDTLKVIHTWASCDKDSNESRSKAMADIAKLSHAVLK